VTWAIPEWWPFLLLALAAWRTFRLLAEDTILDRPREYLLRHTKGKGELFIVCPFCLGFWVSVGWWLAWVAWPHWTRVAATPFALSAVVALVSLIAVNLDAE
jgi:hypothetical protein